jgi:alpha-L-fucosidase
MNRFNDGRDWIFDNPLGMFIHWGIFAQGGWHEQQLWRSHITRKDYDKYLTQFNPGHFNPEEWIDHARSAGMTHMLFTTKHHDGFCMWDTKQTDYNIMNTPYGKDILAELAQACAKKDFKLGLYYSLPDWHHPAYPNIGRHHELFDPPPGGKVDEAAYLDFVYAQVEELLTNYGEIVNFFWDVNVAQFKDPRFNELVRRLQPKAIINDRGPSEGDYSTPERKVPEGTGFEKLTIAVQSTGRESWGFRPSEDYYSHKFMIQSIDKVLSMGGRYILNVGPDEQGRFPQKDVDTLRAIGAWYKKTKESFEDTFPASYMIEPGDAGIISYEETLITRRENTLYVHASNGLQTSGIMLYPMDTLPKKATLLNTGKKVESVVDITPWRWKGRPALRLYDLPVNELAGEVLVIKLEF